jgi:hypothetical protein
MIKKIKCLFVGTLIVFSMPVLAFAEENVTTIAVDAEVTLYNDVETQESESVSEENETEEEDSVEVVEESDEDEPEDAESDKNDRYKSNKFDSKIRTEYMFKSLANRIELQVESAKIIADNAEKLEKDLDFSEIIVSMSILVEEANLYQFNVSVNSEITKVEFESIKERAKKLSQEFKQLAKDLFTLEEKNSIKIELKEAKESNKEEHKLSVQSMRNAIQLDATKKFLDRMGIDSNEVLVKIESGEISENEIKSALKELYRTLKDDKKDDLIKKYKEDKVKRKISKQEISDEIKAKRDVLDQKFKQRRDELKNQFEIHKGELNELKKNNRDEYERLKDSFKEKREAQKELNEDKREAQKELNEEKERLEDKLEVEER